MSNLLIFFGLDDGESSLLSILKSLDSLLLCLSLGKLNLSILVLDLFLGGSDLLLEFFLMVCLQNVDLLSVIGLVLGPSLLEGGDILISSLNHFLISFNFVVEVLHSVVQLKDLTLESGLGGTKVLLLSLDDVHFVSNNLVKSVDSEVLLLGLTSQVLDQLEALVLGGVQVVLSSLELHGDIPNSIKRQWFVDGGVVAVFTV